MKRVLRRGKLGFVVTIVHKQAKEDRAVVPSDETRMLGCGGHAVENGILNTSSACGKSVGNFVHCSYDSANRSSAPNAPPPSLVSLRTFFKYLENSGVVLDAEGAKVI